MHSEGRGKQSRSWRGGRCRRSLTTLLRKSASLKSLRSRKPVPAAAKSRSAGKGSRILSMVPAAQRLGRPPRSAGRAHCGGTLPPAPRRSMGRRLSMGWRGPRQGASLQTGPGAPRRVPARGSCQCPAIDGPGRRRPRHAPARAPRTAGGEGRAEAGLPSPTPL